jgi:UDP-glucose 4-epimerase
MKIAITGARGRLGQYIARQLDENGHDVMRFSREADVEHRAITKLPEILLHNRVDAVLHLGWSTVPATAEMSPGLEWAEDLPLLRDILCSLQRDCPVSHPSPHLIFFSSCAVYGEAAAGESFNESAPTNPKGWYAQAKVHAEEVVQRFAVVHGIDALVMRVSNPYGFRQSVGKQQGIIPRLIRSVKMSEKFVMWGDGSATKDYLHIDDLYKAVELALIQRSTGLLNIARGQSLSLQQLIELVSRSMRGHPIFEKTPAKPWDVQRSFIDIKKSEEVLRWVPSINIENGLMRHIKEAG